MLVGNYYMYTWEIQQELEKYNWNIESKIYLKICQTSPQITLVEYQPYGNQFHMTTSDGLDERFTVYCKDYINSDNE